MQLYRSRPLLTSRRRCALGPWSMLTARAPGVTKTLPPKFRRAARRAGDAQRYFSRVRSPRLYWMRLARAEKRQRAPKQIRATIIIQIDCRRARIYGMYSSVDRLDRNDLFSRDRIGSRHGDGRCAGWRRTQSCAATDGNCAGWNRWLYRLRCGADFT